MPDDEVLIKRILHLREVEKLSLRQIAKELGIDRKKVARLLRRTESSTKPLLQPGILEPYRPVIVQWYQERPLLKATQIYEKLQAYGYQGSYPTVVEFTKEYRKKRRPVYHTLTFLPGQEAQIDWFFFNSETTGKVAGFLYVLSFSRYAWGQFYPKTTFEFFLDAHLKCFEHLGGLAHCHRYDNLKSVVLKRSPCVEYNPQFLDFARHYGFSIYLCQPGAATKRDALRGLSGISAAFYMPKPLKTLTTLIKNIMAGLINAIILSTVPQIKRLKTFYWRKTF